MANGVVEIGDLLNSLGGYTAELDAKENRARTEHSNRLRELATLGLDRRRELGDSFANQGTVHSSANLRAQTNLGSQLDNTRANLNQGLNDTLADIARKRLSAEGQFSIASLLPR